MVIPAASRMHFSEKTFFSDFIFVRKAKSSPASVLGLECIFFFVALITENRFVKLCFHHLLIWKWNKYLHKSEHNHFKMVSHKSDGALERLIRDVSRTLFLWNCATLCDLQKPNIPIRNNIHIQHPKMTSVQLENIRQQSFMKCDRLPASLFDWHQKKWKNHKILHTTKWSKTLWNIPHWHWWTIFSEPKWKYAPFRTYSEYGKVKPKKVKQPIFMDFDLVSGNVRRMCSDWIDRHSHITY